MGFDPYEIEYDIALEKYEESIIDNAILNGTIEEKLFAQKMSELLPYYNIPLDLTTKELSLNRFENELSYCKELLKPLTFDLIPLIRQVEIFKNLIKIKFPKIEDMYYDGKREGKIYNIYKYSYYKIIACIVINPNTLKLEINPLIPKKHYELKLKEIYANTKISSLHIPIENSTEFLCELFEIWIQHTVYNKSAYKIAEELIPYKEKISYDKTQIQRKINSIKTLLTN